MRRGSRNFLQGGGVKRLFDFAGGGGGLSHFFIFINKFIGMISAFFQSHEIV